MKLLGISKLWSSFFLCYIIIIDRNSIVVLILAVIHSLYMKVPSSFIIRIAHAQSQCRDASLRTQRTRQICTFLAGIRDNRTQRQYAMLQHHHHPAFPTSYDANYAYEPSARMIRYRELPSMEPRAQQALRANFITRNAHVAKGPHRILVADRPTGLGLGLATKAPVLFEDKPIVRSSWPQTFDKELVAQTEHLARKLAIPVHSKSDEPTLRYDDCDRQTVDKISVRRRWTSTTREASEEAALPTPRYSPPATTLEPCADSVRHRAKKYHAQPCVWQHFACEWDLMQPRIPTLPLGAQKTGITL